ncbi:MAG: flagellar hook-associated protein FlgK [Roseovarius sp.]
MSISSALSNALSGLAASAAGAQTISANIANALTPGYAPRSLVLTTAGDARGGGVLVRGIARQVDPALLGARRAADGELAAAQVRARFATDLERLAGSADEPGSLPGRLAAFEAALVAAAARPEEEGRLQEAVHSAGALAGSLNHISRQLQAMRGDAEAQIAQAVSNVNEQLRQIHMLNARIIDAANAGHPTASFEDQRRVVLDQLAAELPIRLAMRDNGAVAVYAEGGAVLLDGKPAELSFTAANAITPQMTAEGGQLARLAVNGRAVAPSTIFGHDGAGRISALFDLRDRLAPEAQGRLDALARELVMRFQEPGLDPTRASGDAGLFTDAGAAFDAASETGLALRLSLDPRVDPAAGGAPWRLRDGLGAATPGDSGDATLLNDLAAAMARPAAMASGGLGGTQRSLAGHVATLVARFGQDRLAQEQLVAFATANQAGLTQAEQGMGVDTDAEMQHLLLVEQAYGANARVISVIDDLMDTLLRI